MASFYWFAWVGADCQSEKTGVDLDRVTGVDWANVLDGIGLITSHIMFN